MSAEGINARFGEEIDSIIRAAQHYADNLGLDALTSDLAAFREYAKDNADYIACKERIAAQVIQALRHQIQTNIFGERRKGGNYERSIELIKNVDMHRSYARWKLYLAYWASVSLPSMDFFTIAVSVGVFFWLLNASKVSAREAEESAEALRGIIFRLIDAAVKARIRELIEQADLQEQAP